MILSARYGAVAASLPAGGGVAGPFDLLTPGSVASSGGSISINPNGSVSFTGVNDVRIRTVFNETYTNYRIVMNATRATDDYCTLRLTNGTTLNTSSFTRQLYRNDNGTAQGNRDTSTSGIFSYMNGLFGVTADVFAPMLAEYTGIRTNTAVRKSGYVINDFNTMMMTTTETWDGFIIGNMIGGVTGTIAVYGWGSS